MPMAETILSLYEVSAKLGVSPSAIKKRVASLNLPVDRGARGKLLFNEESYALLRRADEMLKAGAGFEECRRALGLDGQVAVLEPETDVEEVETAEVVEPEPEVAVEAPAAPVVDPVVEANVPALAKAEPEPESDEPPMVSVPQSIDRSLPAPVFIQLGRRKPSDSVRMRMIEHQPTPTPMPASAMQAPEAAPEPEVEAPMAQPRTPAPAPVPAAIDETLIARLDSALKLIEDKDKQNQVLQSKLLVAYDEMTKLSATAAAFQERSMNLQHEVQKLQGEIKLLTAPPERKPWWKFWG